MALETATFLNSLITTWPTGSDQRSTADDHFRLLKGTLLRTFPNIEGEVSVSHAELNLLDSLTANVQAEFNRIFLEGTSATASGTVVLARRAINAEELGSITASRYARLDAAAAFQKGIAPGNVNHGTLSGTLSIDPAEAGYHMVVAGGNIVDITIGAAVAVGQVITIRFQQDGAGGAVITGWPASVVWADDSAFVARATASGIDIVTLAYDALGVWLASPRRYG